MPETQPRGLPAAHSDAERLEPETVREMRLLAVEAAVLAGTDLAVAFGQSMDVSTKSSHHDLVTEYDLATEDAVVRHLSDNGPEAKILGEERGTQGAGQLEWIIDPIDGTSNFAHGFPFFSISIAAVWNNQVVAGVVHDPVNGLTFSADADAAYLIECKTPQESARLHSHVSAASTTENREPFDGERLLGGDRPDQKHPDQKRPSQHRPGESRAGEILPGGDFSGVLAAESAQRASRLNLITSFPSAEVLGRDADTRARALEIYGDLVVSFSSVRRIISGALELCYAAAGRVDVVLGVNTKPWDIAAAMLILRRAGGQYLTAWTGDSDEPAAKTSPDHLAPHYVGLAPGVSSAQAERTLHEVAALVG